MRITASLICAIMFSALAFAAPSQVTDVALQYQDGSAAARIVIKGPVRFTQQTEDAKVGKPFRVIVDILSATHQLPAKNFTTLPKCPVARIRSSQYAVKPEMVVRLVFDMEQPTFYRVTSGDNYVSLFFPDKLHRQFTAWSSREWAASQSTPATDQTKPGGPTVAVTDASKQQPVRKTTAELNSAIDQDRLLSLAGEPAPKKAPSKSTPPVKKPAPAKSQLPAARTTASGDVQTIPPKTPTVSVTVVDTPYGPEFDENLLNLTVPQPLIGESGADNKQPPEPVSAKKSPVKTPVVAKTSAKTSAKPVATTAGTPVPEPKASFEKPAAKPKAQSSQILARKPKTETPAPKVSTPARQKPASTKATSEAPPTSAALAVTDNQTSQKPAVVKPVEKAPDRKQAAPAKSDKSKSGKDTTGTLKEEPGIDKNKSTSRFRRSPTRPTKIKGTLVAEFPKRLVIKYKVRNSRDPFETLINKARVSNSPIEKRVPNIEGLELVGVLESETGSNSALFEDKDGYGYILKEGDKVRNGYVLRVESDRVYFQIFEYGWSRTVALNMDEY